MSNFKVVEYKINDNSILLYSIDDFEFPDSNPNLFIEKVGEVESFDKDPYYTYPIFNVKMFIEAIQGKRNRETKLSEAHVESLKDLSSNYLLCKYKSSPLSRSLREMATEKYIELSEFFSSGESKEE